MSIKRPSWDQYFMQIAVMTAQRGTCDRLKVGAVLVKDREIKATGYNGAPKGIADCNEEGHLMENGHCVRTVHAEQNIMLFSDRSEREGATLYVTATPCFICAKIIANSGIKEVVVQEIYPSLVHHEKMEEYFTKANVTLRVLNPVID